MLINRSPKYGADYSAGYVMFTRQPEALLSDAIKRVTAHRADLAATHCGLVVEKGLVAEAKLGGFRISPLQDYFDDPETLVWFRRPNLLTAERAGVMTGAARLWAAQEIPYDTMGLVGFLLPGEWQEDDKLFCSEAVHKLLTLAGLGPQGDTRPAHEWSPADLDDALSLWMPPL